MTPTEIVLLLVLVCYAIVRQSQEHEVVGGSRFKLAIIYGIVGLLVARSPTSPASATTAGSARSC